MIELFRTATFRTAALAAVAFGTSTLLLFLFIYWQTAGLETARIDAFLGHEAAAIAAKDLPAAKQDVATRYARDLHRQSFAALFTAARQPISGDVTVYPPGLPPDGVPRQVFVIRNGSAGEKVRAIARRLTDGNVVVVGRSEELITRLRRVVLRALELGLLPAMVFALGIGMLASQRVLARLRRVNKTISRIMLGHLHERLESRGTHDAFDKLATEVNRMLDEIERLVAEVQGVGDDIAHDLRTPLARMRARLEGARTRASTHAELAGVVDLAIGDLDQAFTMITALLRIGQIEGGARRAGFSTVNLTAIAREVFELYQPVAELKDITLVLEAAPDLTVSGDRDLLFEVAANLLDNAVKFTPTGGTVRVQAHQEEQGAVLIVQDTGPGIPDSERRAVLQRFHRTDRSRHVPGYGLGLSLVGAILRLHLFHLHLSDAAPGLVATVRTWPE
ncbi:MAG TPA: HAMP domain-containing sensor histidine kinase [Acetobacteraceae bacterium]|nr:HAMP domain-containing sensor histidine kinase [Acetobacteraceae bacterium]